MSRVATALVLITCMFTGVPPARVASAVFEMSKEPPPSGAPTATREAPATELSDAAHELTQVRDPGMQPVRDRPD